MITTFLSLVVYRRVYDYIYINIGEEGSRGPVMYFLLS